MSQIKQNERNTLFNDDIAANFRIAFFALISIAVMTIDHRLQHLEIVRDTLSSLIYPLQYAIQMPFDLSTRLSESFSDHQTLIGENRRLRQRQMLINAQLQKLTALEAENRRLRMLLESSVNIREQVLIAELLTVDSDPYRHQLLLNKGTRQGVHVGQPLLDQEGIIGQIIHANTFTSTAILISDPNHSMPVQVNRNGLRTLAVGTGNFRELELPYIPDNEDIRVGDLLITSGLGRRFPRGYPVARVTKVEFDPGHPFARITAQPTTELDRSREVLLIISVPTPEADTRPVGPYKAP